MSVRRLPVSEADLQRAVIDRAHSLGWRCAHFRKALTGGRWGTPVGADGAGFPDLVLAKDGRVVFVELKSQTGWVTPAQKEWLAALPGSHVWRPSDWFSGTVEATLQ